MGQLLHPQLDQLRHRPLARGVFPHLRVAAVNHRGELAQWSWLRGALTEDERRGEMAEQGVRGKREEPVDPLMQLLYETAIQVFGAPPPLPPSLDGYPIREATKRRADFIRYIEEQLTNCVRTVQGQIPGVNLAQQCPALAAQLRGDQTLDQRTGLFLDDVADRDQRINITLRLYAGYLDTAKTVAWGVTNRKNTAATRFAEIQVVEARAAADPIYRAGVEVTPHYKWRCLGQGIYREGIPAGAAVLRDWDD